MQDISTLKDSPDKEWIPTVGYPKEEEKKLLFQLSSESKKEVTPLSQVMFAKQQPGCYLVLPFQPAKLHPN